MQKYLKTTGTGKTVNFALRAWSISSRANQIDYGCDNWYNLGFNGSVHEFVTSPGNEYVAFKPDRSTDDLLDYFRRDISNDLIALNTIVTAVDYDDQGVTLQTENIGDVTADYAVFTGSLGVLKDRADDLFSPPLSDIKMETIEARQLGAVAKVYLSFDEVWWNPRTSGMAFLYE